MKLIGVDIGGTFTDLILADTDRDSISIHKVPTSSEIYRGMVDGILALTELGGITPADVDHVRLGMTTATNALLQYDGARTGMITTNGYRDIIYIARHQRPMHYSIMQEMPWQDRVLVKRRFRKVVTERLGPRGEVLTPLDENEVVRVTQELKEAGVEAIVICFLFSYRNSAHEDRVKEIVQEVYPDAFVTTSASIFPQFREYERFTAASINAFVGPKVKQAVTQIEASLHDKGIRGDLRIMRSNGGVATAESASDAPVTLLLSGPAAGVLAGQWVGKLSGRENLITLDVGGTSADIGIITPRGIAEASARDTWIAGYPIMVPMIDIHTIGAGGGSIARVDSGGAFRVGPRSAGANPGPACYGRGGKEPTVTDANVVLGRLDKDFFVGGEMEIYPDLSRGAIGSLAEQLHTGVDEAAEGVLTILNHNMANAIRSRTIQKGHDPRKFTLVAFGGAGPLHAVDVARSLGVPEVIVPLYPGITSAMGLLTTDLKYDLIKNEFMLSTNPDTAKLAEDLEELEIQARNQLRKDGVAEKEMLLVRGADCRYVGQGYELRAAIPNGELTSENVNAIWESFHSIHEAEYGHRFAANPIELVNLRVVAVGAVPKIQPPEVKGGASLDEAMVREADLLYRTNGKLEPHKTSFYLRNKLPVGAKFDGPAVVLQKDSTTLLPPGSSAVVEANGNMMVTVGQ
jgi:N-methylhydantoinase A